MPIYLSLQIQFLALLFPPGNLALIILLLSLDKGGNLAAATTAAPSNPGQRKHLAVIPSPPREPRLSATRLRQPSTGPYQPRPSKSLCHCSESKRGFSTSPAPRACRPHPPARNQDISCWCWRRKAGIFSPHVSRCRVRRCLSSLCQSTLSSSRRTMGMMFYRGSNPRTSALGVTRTGQRPLVPHPVKPKASALQSKALRPFSSLLKHICCPSCSSKEPCGSRASFLFSFVLSFAATVDEGVYSTAAAAATAAATAAAAAASAANCCLQLLAWPRTRPGPSTTPSPLLQLLVTPPTTSLSQGNARMFAATSREGVVQFVAAIAPLQHAPTSRGRRGLATTRCGESKRGSPRIKRLKCVNHVRQRGAKYYRI